MLKRGRQAGRQAAIMYMLVSIIVYKARSTAARGVSGNND